MEPDFSHEDIPALVQRDAEMHIGDIGVFIVNGDAFIKELGEKELISRNKKYKNIPIHEGDNVVYGKSNRKSTLLKPKGGFSVDEKELNHKIYRKYVH